MGAIDCTRINISSPGSKNAKNYRSRKNIFSINIQTILDGRLMVQECWPGSSNDSINFFNSSIFRRLETKEFENSLIIGDGSYGMKSYFMIPILNPIIRAK